MNRGDLEWTDGTGRGRMSLIVRIIIYSEGDSNNCNDGCALCASIPRQTGRYAHNPIIAVTPVRYPLHPPFKFTLERSSVSVGRLHLPMFLYLKFAQSYILIGHFDN